MKYRVHSRLDRSGLLRRKVVGLLEPDVAKRLGVGCRVVPENAPTVCARSSRRPHEILGPMRSFVAQRDAAAHVHAAKNVAAAAANKTEVSFHVRSSE